MERKFKKLRIVPIIGMTGVALLAGCNSDGGDSKTSSAEKTFVQPILGHRSVSILEQDGFQFKDLNKDGTLTPYEDWRLSTSERVNDLVARLSIEQKAGLLLHGTPVLTKEGVSDKEIDTLFNTAFVSTLINRMAGDPLLVAANSNKIQDAAEKSQFGIPAVLSTDPRNAFLNDPTATSVGAGAFSQWPETTGLAAIGDTKLVKEFADIARQEYRAVGIHMALSPQADLATEPRWGRIVGTFGEDADLSSAMTKAYIEGFQNGANGLNSGSVAAVVKHFAGGGPQEYGLDPHNSYGKNQVYPGNNFEYHLIPFKAAFESNVSGVMPYYGRPVNLVYKNKLIEAVGFGFNTQVLTEILRGDMAYKGVVLTDFGIMNDCTAECAFGATDEELADPTYSLWAHTNTVGMPWGVEELTIENRYAKAFNAGIDQVGGAKDPQYLLAAIHDGLISEAKVTESAKRILTQKFELGLFENPYVDEAMAVKTVGNAEFQAKADIAQSKSHVLLKNHNGILPITDTTKRVYLYNVNAAVAKEFGFTVVTDLADADLAILRVDTPAELDSHYITGYVHQGQLGFSSNADVVHDTNMVNVGVYTGGKDFDAIKAVKAAGVPSIVSVYMDRPAILTDVIDDMDAVLVNFGVLDRNLFKTLLGTVPPQGKLPFELPSSWAAVLEQKEDVPYDSKAPLFAFGFGLSNYGK